MKKTNIIVSEKKWHKEMYLEIKRNIKVSDWILIENKETFNVDFLKKFDIEKIFIPHWSSLIHESIYNKYECIVFHMTDLPFGRGGSPLQNLILRGYKETKICAIQVSKGIDAGPVYLKKNLSLDGTAYEILIRATAIIKKMILELISKKINPLPQTGEITIFKRRSPSESNISQLNDLNEVYDYVRMLDCEGYPKAFLESNDIKFEFTKARFNSDNQIEANVKIYKK